MKLQILITSGFIIVVVLGILMLHIEIAQMGWKRGKGLSGYHKTNNWDKGFDNDTIECNGIYNDN